jgi:hypothetical protein
MTGLVTCDVCGLCEVVDAVACGIGCPRCGSRCVEVTQLPPRPAFFSVELELRSRSAVFEGGILVANGGAYVPMTRAA